MTRNAPLSLGERVRVRVRPFFTLLTLFTLPAHAGSHAPVGGTLQVAVVDPAPRVDPLTADTPVDAARLLLVNSLLCDAVDFSRPSATTLRLTPRPAIEPKWILDALQRVTASTTPARALLSSVGGITPVAGAIELQLSLPAPDLERALCHPAFALPIGPFRAKGQTLQAEAEQPWGRPFLDAVTLQATDERTAERLFAQRRVQLVLGSATADDAPQLFVTALLLGPDSAGLRAAIESVIDRGDLARFFVPAPSGALPALLPGATPAPRPERPAPLSPPRELSLSFDEAAPHERAIAQRLQVKLQPLGFRLALKALPHGDTSAPRSNELRLASFALPPSPAGSLLMWLELSGRRARIPQLLQQLASAPDVDARARELATQLQAELPVLPLVTRGLGVTASRDLQHLSRDAMGLPRLADAFLLAD